MRSDPEILTFCYENFKHREKWTTMKKKSWVRHCDSVISDIGLTILAQVCLRLLKLELVGCEGSYDMIKAIGQCCQMMEELTLCDHKLEGSCPTLEELYLESCQLIDKQGLRALFLVCEAVRHLVFSDCWGLDNNAFSAASVCRYDYAMILFFPHGVLSSWYLYQHIKKLKCGELK
ncbi:putative leucine-rich repeat domain superfamily [Helianthus annuus]|nr:putative leucine-rich repeat domain superfamily [Helianthus annuus]